MSTDKQELTWKLNNVRESISLDWKNLATKNLTADQRKAIRERLEICNSTLKDLVLRPVLCHFLLATRSQSARLFSRGLPSARFAQLGGAVFPTDGGLFGEG